MVGILPHCFSFTGIAFQWTWFISPDINDVRADLDGEAWSEFHPIAFHSLVLVAQHDKSRVQYSLPHCRRFPILRSP